MKPPETIELELSDTNAREPVDFAAFRKLCAAVAECLSRSEQVVTGRKGRIAYRITDLRTGNAHMTIEPTRKADSRGRDRRAQVVRFFNRTIAAIETGKQVDKRLGIDDLHAFKKLAIPLGRGAGQIRIGGTDITPAFIANTDNLLNDTIPSDGSVSGIVERINIHERNEFVLFPPIQGYSVSCRFADGLLDEVRTALKRNVTVFGTMHYSADGPFPRMVSVRRMEIHPNDSQLPTLSDLRGIGKGCTDDLTAVEFVRRLRDD